MRIAISINEVLRDFIGQLIYTYNKYVSPRIDIKENDVTDFNLIKHFPFNSINDLNRFIYTEASLEIFGHADQLTDGIMNQFNNFITTIKDGEEHQIELVSREANKSIPSTFFFLSKNACRAESIRFVTDSINEWGDADILITANPDALKNKPNGKISVKIKSYYNEDIKADFELGSLLEFMKDENLRNTILNTKIINYEEI